MNAKTKEAIQRHGESLLLAFPNATEKDAIVLCKKLRRIETSLQKPLLDYCNGTDFMGDDGEKRLDAICDKAIEKVVKLLGCKWASGENCVRFTGLHVNRDPRGYALKFDCEWTKQYNDQIWKTDPKKQIFTDWGGFGILAPDLTNC